MSFSQMITELHHPPALAITIYPVWAWAIMAGVKRVENRSWRTHHRGRLWIHASGASRAAQQSDSDARAALASLGVKVPDEVVHGAILGSVDLRNVVAVEEMISDPLASGPWCWVIAAPKPLRRPIPYRGRQRIFRLSAPF